MLPFFVLLYYIWIVWGKFSFACLRGAVSLFSHSVNAVFSFLRAGMGVNGPVARMLLPFFVFLASLLSFWCLFSVVRLSRCISSALNEPQKNHTWCVRSSPCQKSPQTVPNAVHPIQSPFYLIWLQDDFINYLYLLEIWHSGGLYGVRCIFCTHLAGKRCISELAPIDLCFRVQDISINNN